MKTTQRNIKIRPCCVIVEGSLEEGYNDIILHIFNPAGESSNTYTGKYKSDNDPSAEDFDAIENAIMINYDGYPVSIIINQQDDNFYHGTISE